MSYATELAKINRTKITKVEFDLTVCDLTWNTAPCTPAGGASECYNTHRTCNDYDVFSSTPKVAIQSNTSTKTYKFTSANLPAPANDCRPYLKGYNPLSQEIKDNITVKNRISIELFEDNNESDITEDPYWSTRGHTSVNVNGGYFKRLFARNPAFKYKDVRIYEGFLLNNALEGSWQLRFTGKIENIYFERGVWRLECIDNLKFLDTQELTTECRGKLEVDIDWFQTTGISVTSTSGMAASGYILVDDEIIKYTSLSGTTLVTVTRGSYGTLRSSHQKGADITRVQHYEGYFFDIIEQIFIDYGIPYDAAALAELSGWQTYTSDPAIACIITEKTKVSDLFYELVEQFGCRVWLDEEGSVVIRRNIFHSVLPTPPTYLSSQVILTDAEHIIKDSVSFDWNEKNRYSRLTYYYNLRTTAAKRVLSSAINNSVLTIPVSSVEDMPDQGDIIIGTEWIEYTSLDLSTPAINANAKGVRGTTAASHSSGDAVYQGDMSSIKDVKNPLAYEDAIVTIDDDAETGHERSDAKVIYSRWFNDFAQYAPTSFTITGYGTYLTTLGTKILALIRDARIRLSYQLEIKDEDLNLGDFHKMSIDDLNNIDCTDYEEVQFQVVKKEPGEGNKLKYISEKIPSTD